MINPNEASRIRADQALAIVQKAEAVAHGVRDDGLRDEGALAALAETARRFDLVLTSTKESFHAGEDQARCEGIRDGILQALRALEGYKSEVEAHARMQAGRSLQCQQHIEVLNAIARSEDAAANRVHERPQSTSGHPGSSLAQQRRAESHAEQPS